MGLSGLCHSCSLKVSRTHLLDLTTVTISDFMVDGSSARSLLGSTIRLARFVWRLPSPAA
jgi:hypothetical protein